MTDRKELIGRLEEISVYDVRYGEEIIDSDSMSAISDAIAELQKPEWISVEDRLPENDPYIEKVEIAYWDGICMCRTFGIFCGGEWWSGGDALEECGIKVTHYREVTPLPEPPEVKNENKT